MTPLEHGLSGGILAFGLHPLFRKHLSKPKAVLITAVAATWPDVDYLSWLAGRDFYYNRIDDLVYSHRGITHTLGGAFLFSGVVLALCGLYFSLPPYRDGRKNLLQVSLLAGLGFVGTCLHLFEDFLGANGPWKGLVLFYPFSTTRYKCLAVYGWYNFNLIYLFTAAFVWLVLLHTWFWLRPRPQGSISGMLTAITVLVAVAYPVQYCLRSPGYHEQLGLARAEREWKAFQLGLLPGPLRELSDRAQTQGMDALFASKSASVPKSDLNAPRLVFLGLLAIVASLLVVLIRSRRRLPARDDPAPGTPLRNLCFAVLVLFVLPLLGAGCYYRGKLPIQVAADDLPVASGFDYPVGDVDHAGFNGVDEGAGLSRPIS